MIGILTIVYIFIAEENIVNDFLIQFPCWRVIYLCPNLSIMKGTSPSGQVPLFIMESLITPQLLPARRLTNIDNQLLTESLISQSASLYVSLDGPTVDQRQ